MNKKLSALAPTRGSDPEPHWGLWPQTPVETGAPHTCHGPALANPGSAAASDG